MELPPLKRVELAEKIDRISYLPDDVLHAILKRLDTKSAMATSLLSRRWRHHFRCIADFHFTFIDSPPSSPLDFSISKYREAIDCFSNPLTFPNVNSLSIELARTENRPNELLEQCVRAALSRNVEHLRFTDKKNHSTSAWDFYSFPFHCFDNENGACLQSLLLSGCRLRVPKAFCGFSSLKKLTLEYMSFSKEERQEQTPPMQLVLNGCTQLESLHISDSGRIDMLKIDLLNPKLKELTISRCELVNVKIISAPVLERVIVWGEYITMGIVSAPCLSHASFVVDRDPYKCVFYYSDDRLQVRLDETAAGAPLLETLDLQLGLQSGWIDPACSAPFSKLKSLKLAAVMENVCDVLWIGQLLEAMPLLEILEIKINSKLFEESVEKLSSQSYEFQHDRLKVLKVMDFSANELEMGLVRRIMDRAVALEKVILSCENSYCEEQIKGKEDTILKHLRNGISSNASIVFTLRK